jgi:hypothetical protein
MLRKVLLISALSSFCNSAMVKSMDLVTFPKRKERKIQMRSGVFTVREYCNQTNITVESFFAVLGYLVSHSKALSTFLSVPSLTSFSTVSVRWSTYMGPTSKTLEASSIRHQLLRWNKVFVGQAQAPTIIIVKINLSEVYAVLPSN